MSSAIDKTKCFPRVLYMFTLTFTPSQLRKWKSPLMLITTYNRENQPIKEIIFKYVLMLDRCSATRPLTNKDIMATFKKPKPIKDILGRAKISKVKQRSQPKCNRPKTCQYCTRISCNGNKPDITHLICFILWCMAIAKVTVRYISWNVISAIQSMWVKCKIEYLTSLTSETVKLLLWLGVLLVMGILPVLCWLYSLWNTSKCPKTYQGPSKRGKRKLTRTHRLDTLIPSDLNITDWDAVSQERISRLNK